MTWWFVGVALAAVLVLACLSPLETARWWPKRGRARTRDAVAGGDPDHCPPGLPERYLVYLSGVGDIDPEADPHEDEQWILAEIAREFPQVKVLAGVHPYAVDSRALQNKTTGGSWEAASHLGEGPRTVIRDLLLQARNVGQALWAADPRYGPTYYADLGRQVWDELTDHGYVRGCRVPVTFLGYSGGAQMGLGASWFLTLFHVPCTVIALGGVYSDDRGFAHVEHFWDVRGSKDLLRRIGPLMCPGRWPINVWSTIHTARRAGRVSFVNVGPVAHDGDDGYFDADASLPDGRSHAEATRDAIVTALREAQDLPGGSGAPEL